MSFKLDLSIDAHHTLYTTARMLSEQSFFNGLYRFLGIQDVIKHPTLDKNSTYREIVDNHNRQESIIKSIKEIRFTNNHGSGFTAYNKEQYQHAVSYSVKWVHYVFGLYSLYKENIIKPDDVKWKVETVFRDGLIVTNYFRNDYTNFVNHLYTSNIGKELINLYLIAVYLRNLGNKHKGLTADGCVFDWLNYKYEDKVHNLLTRYGGSPYIYTLLPKELCNAMGGGKVQVSGIFGSRLLDLNIISPYYPFSYYFIDEKNPTKLRLDRGIETYTNIISTTLREIKPEDFS